MAKETGNFMLYAWLSTSLIRHYPRTPRTERSTLSITVARGQRMSFQAAFQSDNGPVTVTAESVESGGLPVEIRRIGYVPIPHLTTETPEEELDGVDYLPGLAPEPLFPEQSVTVGVRETHAFFVTLTIPVDVTPGEYPITLRLTTDKGDEQTLTAHVHVHRAVQPRRQNFPVTHWFYLDSLFDWYKVEPFEERFWTIVEAYLKNLTTHLQDVVYVSWLTPPLSGEHRPQQLVGIQKDGDKYTFDWTHVRRWVNAARDAGLEYFEWAHIFTQWGVRCGTRIFAGHGETNELLLPSDTGATSPDFRNFLSQLLPELHRFLLEENILENSFFHVSDEPYKNDIPAYRAAREMLRELAPWMQVMDATSDTEIAQDNLMDIAIPEISSWHKFKAANIDSWCYFCCYPRGTFLNRFMDTPLAKLRMSGWLFYRTRVQGFLHWGYNYWYRDNTTELIDPFALSDAGLWPVWPCGDPFIVYPGVDGPIDGLRWEVFTESLQDYALLQASGISPDDPMLVDIKGYDDFPKSEAWIEERRLVLLDRVAQRQGD